MKLLDNLRNSKKWLAWTPLLTLLAVLFGGTIFSQIADKPEFNKSNTEQIYSLISFSPDCDGIWIKRPPFNADKITADDSITILGKNNKQRKLFLLGKDAIYEITLSKDEYSPYKKNKLIPNLKDEEWLVVLDQETTGLHNRYQAINYVRRKFIEDSIAELRRIEYEAEMRRQDSIMAIREAERIKAEDEDYRLHHSKLRFPINNLIEKLSYSEKNSLLSCVFTDCNYTITNDEFLTKGLRNDTLLIQSTVNGPLNTPYLMNHIIPITPRLQQDKDISSYLRAWGDSLRYDYDHIYNDSANFSNPVELTVAILNYNSLNNLIDKVKKKAPNGYIEDWSWDNDYGPVELNITYCNTTKKTIKYLKVFFSIYNDVGDLRGSGSVQGTGPVEEFSSGSWEFGYTGCWVSGDASRMKITKLVITYMNGSTATLTGKKIIFEEDYE